MKAELPWLMQNWDMIELLQSKLEHTEYFNYELINHINELM